MHHFFSCLLFSVILSPLFAQSSLCENSYMPFHEGTSFEVTTYNSKGKVGSIVQHQIRSIEKTTDGYQAAVTTNVMDDKGKSSINGQYTIQCNGDGVSLDISSMLAPETMAAFGSMQVDVTGTGLEIPNVMTSGQTLPDGSMQMQASMNGMSLIKLTVQITDRKVEGSASVTTPAGTFQCMKLRQTTSMEGFGKNTYTSTSWYAKGVGMVRTETYDKKGEISSYTELTKFEQS